MKLLKFGAEWCAPCKTMEERLKDFTGCEVKHYDVDSDDTETLELIEKFNTQWKDLFGEIGDACSEAGMTV